MRIALLHLELSSGPEERNIVLLEQAIALAAKAGAQWIVTPEPAVQGYFFTQKNRVYEIKAQPAPIIAPISKLAKEYGLTVFLGCAELDEKTGNCYNSCLVIGPTGEIIGRHRKMRSHGKGAEGWAAKGTVLEAIQCDEMKAGVLVCADSYFEENGINLSKQGAEIIIVPAAWPPGGCGGPPEIAWKRCSRASGLPVVVCNQTGNSEAMDMSQAQSAVIVDGKLQLCHSGLEQVVLLFDWDIKNKQLLSNKFETLIV